MSFLPAFSYVEHAVERAFALVLLPVSGGSNGNADLCTSAIPALDTPRKLCYNWCKEAHDNTRTFSFPTRIKEMIICRPFR